MKKVKLDISELMNTFESGSLELRHYLDLKTGEILLISDFDEDEELNDKIEKEYNTRYKSIPHIESHEGYRDMEFFVETVEDTNLKEKLCIAINGKGAFRRFKDVLLSYPEERERWFKFKDEMVKERVMSWLESEEIEIE